MKMLCVALLLGLTLAMASCSRKKDPAEPQDLESVRASLREEVAKGELTKEEAVVKLAEAQAGIGLKQEKEDSKLSPKLEALGKELKEKVAKGDMTDEEATAAWLKAAGKTEDSKDSAKEMK